MYCPDIFPRFFCIILLITQTLSVCRVLGTIVGTRNAMVDEVQDLVGKTCVSMARCCLCVGIEM